MRVTEKERLIHTLLFSYVRIQIEKLSKKIDNFFEYSLAI